MHHAPKCCRITITQKLLITQSRNFFAKPRNHAITQEKSPNHTITQTAGGILVVYVLITTSSTHVPFSALIILIISIAKLKSL